MNIRNLLISPAALLLLGSASVVYSPISCGCMTEAEGFLQYFNIQRSALGNPKSPDTEVVNRAVTKRLSNKKVGLDTLPAISSCAKVSQTLYRCTYWLWRAPGRERGVEVTIVLNHASVFESSSVRPALRIAAPALPGETADSET